MPISNTYYFNQSIPLTEYASDLELAILEELRRVTNNLIEDPGADFSNRIAEFAQQEVRKWEQNAEKWVLATLPAVYLRGIMIQDSELKRILKNPNDPNREIIISQMFSRGSGQVTDRIRESLRGFQRHFTAYAVLEANARDSLRQTISPVLRSTNDMYRQVANETLTPAFRTGETATRRDLSQRMMDKFAKQGVTGITYKNGARIPIDVYSEMVGRTATRNASQQASINRLSERGYDLVRVTEYAGASNLCYPWQGRVYSLMGDSDKYPSFDSAMFNGNTGLFHPNCGHSHSAYIPGASEGLGALSDDPYEQKILDEMGEAKGNRFIYNQRQRQRQIERNIRKYKKQSAVALNPSVRKRKEQLVRNWQERQRELIEENPFLKRKYTRESI